MCDWKVKKVLVKRFVKKEKMAGELTMWETWEMKWKSKRQKWWRKEAWHRDHLENKSFVLTNKSLQFIFFLQEAKEKMEEQKKEMQRQMQEMRDRTHGNGMCKYFRCEHETVLQELLCYS